MIRDARTRFFRPLLLAVILASISVRSADDAMDRLVRLVGPEAGTLPGGAPSGRNADRVQTGGVFPAFGAPEILQRVEGGVPKKPGHRQPRDICGHSERKPARPFVRDVLGTAVVIAAYTEPGPEMSAILLSQAVSHESAGGRDQNVDSRGRVPRRDGSIWPLHLSQTNQRGEDRPRGTDVILRDTRSNAASLRSRGTCPPCFDTLRPDGSPRDPFRFARVSTIPALFEHKLCGPRVH